MGRQWRFLNWLGNVSREKRATRTVLTLMEHEGVMVETKQVPGIGSLLDPENCVEITRWGRDGSGDPLVNSAVVHDTLLAG
jgi:hypothetical protein